MVVSLEVKVMQKAEGRSGTVLKPVESDGLGLSEAIESILDVFSI